jgi:ABC-type Fe3+ transport system substrate-binding protein
MRARAFAAAVLGLWLALLPEPGGRLAAQPAARPLVIAGVEPAAALRPLLDALAAHAPTLAVQYRQAPPSRIMAHLTTRMGDAEPIDVVILPTPDLAIHLANEGVTARSSRLARQHGLPQASHWRGEVFAVGYDPAVFVTRRGAFAPGDAPHTRTDLVHMLEQSRARLQGRVGLVNIGIDNVSYAFAAQDSLRSPLFWRIARAFGASGARIFDSADELLEALAAGRIDFGYNVPLSTARKWTNRGLPVELVVPTDYIVALPWTALIPERSRDGAEEAVDFLLSDRADAAFGEIGLTRLGELSEMANVQQIELGPELLVHLDAVKRSRFLSTWFQFVVQE